MDTRPAFPLASRLWLVFVLLSANLRSSTLGAGDGKKLANVQNPGFISIDCGVDHDYLDEETGIFYKSDGDFISTGINRDISPEYAEEVPYGGQQFGRLLKNLRYFPEGRKNCYNLKPEQGKNHTYIIRAFGKYGNYDAKNQVQKFDIYIGVNPWFTVRPINASAWGAFEIIHFSVTDTIHVCLIDTFSGTPSLSALELRLLNNSMYKTESGTLLAYGRLNVGNTTSTTSRYKDDAYDRLWTNYAQPDWVPIKSTSSIDIQSINDSYKLPAEVLGTAVQPRDNITSLNASIPLGYPVDFYVYLHFAEIVKTAPGQRREFTVTVNGENYGPITLEYLKPQTIISKGVSSEQGYVQFFLNSTKQSDLPPILNAFEVYAILDLPNSPTDQRDVGAIMDIKQMYKINRNDWQGDPCLPSDIPWSGISCNIDTKVPRIISVNLSGSKLRGEIAPSLANLNAIQSLDLSFNELTGEVPEFLAQLLNLTFLNLTGNKLTGSIPQSLTEKSNKGMLQMSFDRNPNLCQTDSCKKKKQNFLLLISAAIVSVSLLVFLIVIAVLWRMKRQEGTVLESRKDASLKSRNRSLTYSEIVSITNNFEDVIGEGGFGKVYLGSLEDGTQVAVKLLSQSSQQGYKEFQAEVQLLLLVHHRNLVSLIGSCDELQNKALVYEYMAKGNLRQHLSDTSTDALTWTERLQIAVDAAYGLEYLHNGCKPPIIHRDFKTTNILLNESLQAKIADFGLSRAFATERDSHVTTRVGGTFAYLDPEFFASGSFSRKNDVYSFGIVLFEMITGQPAVIRVQECITHILQWVSSIIETGDIDSIVDPRLRGEFDANSAWKIVEIAMSCVHRTATERPDMGLVLAELKECLAAEDASRRNLGTQNMSTGLSNSIEMSGPSPR